MRAARFEPETLIELDDSMQGFRKLAIVAESGEAYVDLIEDDATLFPTYQALRPVTVGNSLSWAFEILDQRPNEARAFAELQRRLLDAGLDSLTYNRALHWAYQARAYGFPQALRAGREATDQVRQSRMQMDQIVRRGRAAHLRLV